MLKVEAVPLPLAGGRGSFKYTSALKKIKRLHGKGTAVRKIRTGIFHRVQVSTPPCRWAGSYGLAALTGETPVGGQTRPCQSGRRHAING